VKDDQIILERNDDYWGEKAKLDRIILKSIPEPSARLMALQSGTVDIADDLDPDSINLVKKEAKHAIIERPSINVGYLALNTEKPALKDVRVRQAINHAIDKATLIKTVFQGLAIPAKNPFAPSIWGYNDSIKDYEYSPEKAKKLLAEAKFDTNMEIELWAMPVSRAYMPDPVKTAELIQAYLAAAGIKAKIVRHEWGLISTRLVTVCTTCACSAGWAETQTRTISSTVCSQRTWPRHRMLPTRLCGKMPSTRKSVSRHRRSLIRQSGQSST